MKTLRLLFLALIAALSLSGCDHEEYDKMPREIAAFISQYWHDPNIESCTQPNDDTWVIIVKNGPSLTFNGSYDWTSINGNGLPLPQVLLFDRLPGTLYRYLESGEMLGQVFSIERTPKLYTLRLLTQTVTYDIGSDTVRQEDTPPSN